MILIALGSNLKSETYGDPIKNCNKAMEFLEKRFDNATRTMVAFFLMISFVVTLLPIVLYTGAINLESIFNISEMLEISKNKGIWITVIGIGIIGSIYAIFGGLKAVAISDTINVCYEAWKNNKCTHYSISNHKSYKIIEVAKMFKTKIKYIPFRAGERYASALTNLSFNKKVLKRYGKIRLKDYISSFIKSKI